MVISQAKTQHLSWQIDVDMLDKGPECEMSFKQGWSNWSSKADKCLTTFQEILFHNQKKFEVNNYLGVSRVLNITLLK